MYTREDRDRRQDGTTLEFMPGNADAETIAKSMHTIEGWELMKFPEGCGIAYKWGLSITEEKPEKKGEKPEKKIVHAYFHVPYCIKGDEITDEMHQKMYTMLADLLVGTSKDLMEEHGTERVDGLMVTAPDSMVATLEEFLNG